MKDTCVPDTLGNPPHCNNVHCQTLLQSQASVLLPQNTRVTQLAQKILSSINNFNDDYIY